MQDMFDNASFFSASTFCPLREDAASISRGVGRVYAWRVVVVVKFCPSQANITYPSSILIQKEALHENQVNVAFLVTTK